MARARRGGSRRTREPKEKPARKAKPERKPKPAKEPVAEEMAGDAPDMMPVALVVLTSVLLLVATVLAWIQLGGYGAGPFS